MRLALREAQNAYDQDEVPVGVVIVSDGRVIAKAYNQTQLLGDVTAHAEIIAITAAANHLGAKYLEGCKVYITLEPCVMCAGALNWARPDSIIYGAADPERGFMRYGKEILHPQTKLEFGIGMEESSYLLKSFFKEKRKMKPNRN